MTEFDSTLDRIGRYISGLNWSDVDERAAAAVVDHLYDSVGCMYGGLITEFVVDARRLADATPSDPGATVLGSARPVAPEYAVFANTAMVRAIDFNDSGGDGPGGGHPSDAIPAVIAAAELSGASGEQLVLGVYAAYEVFAAVGRVVELRPRGWDHTLTTGIAATAGACKVLGLASDAVSNAAAIMFTTGLAFGVTRVGPLSHWKNLAAAHATMNGHFASRLAANGITGPPRAVEGPKGFWEVYGGGRFELPALGQPLDGRSAAERAHYKLIAAEGTSLGVLVALLGLYEEGIRPDNIAGIVVRTFDLCYTEIGGGQGDHDEKWNPQNRETADHSLPYMMAVALSDGNVGSNSFSDERIADPALRPLMDKISVELDTSPAGQWGRAGTNWSERPSHDIEVSFTDGSRRRLRAPLHTRGHFTNPATKEDLTRKFDTQVQAVLGKDRCQVLTDALWNLPDAKDLSDLVQILRTPVT